MRFPRRTAAALVAIVAATSLAACGSSSTGGSVSQAATSATSNGVENLSADEILARAKEAMAGQTSVALVGESTGSGSAGIALDLKVVKGGTSGGSVTLDGQQFDLITTSSDIYIKADKEFWGKQGNAKAAEIIGTRWVKVPANDENWSQLGNFGNFEKVTGELLTPTGTISKGQTTDVGGTKAIALESSKGTLWVATTGQPLPLRIDRKDGEGQLTMKDWGRSFDVAIPADGDVIDIAKLQATS